MGCKSICLQYKAVRTSNSKRYSNGQVRCMICDIFMTYSGLFCPCCGIRVRTRPRNAKYKYLPAKINDTSPIKCLNKSCENNLSKFDLERIGVKFSWARFCINCRRHKDRIKYINCLQCKKIMPFIVGNYNVVKIYCPECAKIRHRKTVKINSFQ